MSDACKGRDTLRVAAFLIQFYATVSRMRPYVVLDKAAGETPLQTLERYRATQPALAGVPMAYAGRLDPMASGKLLILIGEECKRQQQYHALDKAYTVQILAGIRSDTGDILGRLETHPPPPLTAADFSRVVTTLPRTLTLPYPHFSAKTVAGKPLHVWTLEGRLDEITIPEQTGTVYQCRLLGVRYQTGPELRDTALERINRLPTVTETSKALGADFRRSDVRADWEQLAARYADTQFPVATITCTVSSGTYMRSLAEYIGQHLNTSGLAFSIHRTHIGRYRPLIGRFGWWSTTYR